MRLLTALIPLALLTGCPGTPKDTAPDDSTTGGDSNPTGTDADGDGYFAEAGSIAEAVRFALLFQHAMREGPWREVRLTTRVGIHAGEIGMIDSALNSDIVASFATVGFQQSMLLHDRSSTPL